MSVQITTLDNGLRVVTDSMPGVETATVGAWIAVGTRHEQPQVNGVSHMLEHMAFKGTARRGAWEIAEEIEAVGGHLNAYTSREHTAYHAKVLKEDVPLAIDIIADILQNSVFDEAELARERTVILQEINQSLDTPDDIIFDYFQETAYPDQAIGRPVLGSAELIREMSRDDVVTYLQQHYSTPRMVVAGAGRLEHDAFVDLVANAFSSLPSHNGTAPEPATYIGGDFRQSRDLEQVHVLLGFSGLAYGDPDFYTASVLTTLLGGGMSSRLFQEVREKRGLAYSIYSFASAYSDSGLVGVYAGTGESEVAELMPVVCDEIGKVCAGIEEEEVARSRAQLKASILMSLESTSSRCEQLARQLLVFGRHLPTEEIVAKVNGVDPAAVSRVARRVLAQKPVFAALGPLARVDSFDSIAARLVA